ncbi:MAG: hypothetical protein DI622_18630 [Chryseobacterium sp.]|nr:MAG: hypothetical protein DI622_18630 [Chryseobacterium sp.]
MYQHKERKLYCKNVFDTVFDSINTNDEKKSRSNTQMKKKNEPPKFSEALFLITDLRNKT